MPTYEYRCNNCGHQFETMQSITADPLVECPECQGELKRLISGGTGLIFKGSGFYITDYAKNRSGSQSRGKTTKKKEPSTPSPSKTDDSSSGDSSSSSSKPADTD